MKLLQTAAYFAAYFMLGAIMASLGPTLPGLAENVGVTLATMGMVFSARSFGYLSGALLGGWLYDRVAGNRVLALWAVLSSLSLWLLPDAAIFVILAVLMFVIGLSQGANDVGCNTQLARVHGSKVGPYLNAMFFFAGLGSFLIPLLIGAVSMESGYQILALGLLPVALLLFLTPSPARQSETHTTTEGVSSVFLILFALLAFIYVGTEVSFGGWILSYYQSANPDAESASYMLNSFFYLAILIGRFLAILLAVFLRPRHQIWMFLGGAALSAALMSLLPAQPWSIWLGTVGMGLSIAAIFPTTFNYVGSKAQLSGKQNGLVWAVGSLGAIILPWVIGKTFDLQGVLNMMSILLVLWLIASGLFLALSRVGSQKVA